MASPKQHTFAPFALALMVIGLLLVAGQVPPMRLEQGLRTKRINILSDIYRSPLPAEILDTLTYSDTSFLAESRVASDSGRLVEAQSTPQGTSQSWGVSSSGFEAMPVDLGADDDSLSPQTPASLADYPAPATTIEDHSADGMAGFYAALQRGRAGRPVRVAVLGDSFIEADILTADVREQLQDAFGGGGVGFVPFASPLSKFRGTVRHTFDGWQTYNVMQKKNAPAAVQDKFYISGWACIPQEGAWTRIVGTQYRQHLRSASVARILFTATGRTTLSVTINDSLTRRFTPEPSELIQQIDLHGDISSLEIRITGAAGFTGYGIVLEEPRGVSVDNYSIRGNSGMALYGTNSAVNMQMGRLLGYDLIVLQYGLNSMSANVLNYTPYVEQTLGIIDYVRSCFPGVPILLMSVGDRGTRQGGQYVTMPAAKAMLASQQTIARQAGVAFWNTFEAMGGEGSMARFVDNRWAARDYTHIGDAGGRHIGTQLVRSLVAGYRSRSSSAPTHDFPPFYVHMPWMAQTEAR